MKFFSNACLILAAACSLSQATVVGKRDFADNILKNIESASTCSACEVSLSYELNFGSMCPLLSTLLKLSMIWAGF